MCCARPSCASGWMGWRKGPPISSAHGYPDPPCVSWVGSRGHGASVVARPDELHLVWEVWEFFDRGDTRTFCEALSEKIKRSLVVRRECYEKSHLKRRYPDCLRSVGSGTPHHPGGWRIQR